MIAGLAKFIGGKVLTAILVVTSVIVLIWYWQLPPQAKEAIWTAIKAGLVWIGFAAILPWALFFLPELVLRAESNLASAALLIGYLAADVLVALWLGGGKVGSALGWALMLLGFLAAGVYNFVVCEFLASRLEQQL
ncbi:MAG: hypothetical protein ACE5K7_02660 [Phycisphaerae bacterium]